MTTIYTVDVAKFTAPVTGKPAGTVDVCCDEHRNIHIRINKDGDEVVLVLNRNQVRRVREMIDKAIDGLVPMSGA